MQKDDLLKWAQMSPTPVATEPNVSQSATTTMIQPADLETEVQQVVQALTRRGIDITVGYANWRNLAFALADGLGESGRSYFHELSRLNADYNYTECDKQYTACLHGRGSGITIKTFFAMAKEGGVDLSEVFASFAKLQGCKNREKEEKKGDFDDFGSILQDCNLAKLAKSPADTFSDKLDVDDLPLFLHPIWDYHTDPADRDKMILGTLDTVSGIITDSVYGIYDKRVVYTPSYCIVVGPFGSSKGDLEACRQLVQPIVEEIRKQYEREMAAYKNELAEWESQGKGKQGPKPEEPVKRSLIIPANSSSSAVYRALEANGGTGLVFETEADTLTNMLSNKEYGNYSDLLRRAFHHETVSMVRVTDQVNIEIEEPRLAVFMTCTSNQLVLLLPAANLSNGLASRFLFYLLPSKEIQFHNVFAGNEKSLKQVYREMGEQLLPLYHDLAARKPRSIQFVLSQAQREEFLATFDAMVKEQCRLSGDEMQGFIYRVALSGFRYAMILSILRRLTKERENYFDPHEKALICEDRDFRTMMTIMNCMVNHTARVYAVIGQQEQDPFKQDLSKLKEGKRTFYQALPDRMFSSGEALRIAKEQKISKSSAYHCLGELCSKYNLLRRVRNGVYVKILPKQDDSAE